MHGLPLLVERFARVVFAAPLAQHGERVARVAPVVEQPVRRQERYGIADRTDRKTARQRLAHRTGDRFGFGFPPAHAADEHQRGAVVGQRRRVAVRRDGQSAQRTHRPPARRCVLHFVPPFAARHDTRAEGWGEKRRLPVREIVQQDEINRFPVHRISCFVRPPSCGGRMSCPIRRSRRAATCRRRSPPRLP